MAMVKAGGESRRTFTAMLRGRYGIGWTILAAVAIAALLVATVTVGLIAFISGPAAGVFSVSVTLVALAIWLRELRAKDGSTKN
jgi:hypothetical protein